MWSTAGIQLRLRRAVALALLCSLIPLAIAQPQQVLHKEPMLNTILLESGTLWRDCMPAKLVAAESIGQVASVIQAAYQELTEDDKEVVIRASRNKFLSHNNFTCPQATGPYGVQLTMLDMGSMNAVLAVEGGTVTVQAGITFQALEEELLQHGLGLPGIVLTPPWADMSLGSALVTGAHGSSLVGPASIAPYVMQATIVDGTGSIRVLDKPAPLLEGSLGLLGVVVQLTLQVAPARKVSVAEEQGEDANMVHELRHIVEGSTADALEVTWSPAAALYTARLWQEAAAQEEGDARNAYLQGSKKWVSKVNKQLVADQQDLADHAGAMCSLLGDFAAMPHFTDLAPGQKPPGSSKRTKKSRRQKGPDNGAKGQAGKEEQAAEPQGGGAGNEDANQALGARTWVGWPGRMAGMRCPEGASCLWQRSKYTPYEVVIASEDLADWVTDAKAIFGAAKGCPPFLVQLRFMAASDAPLSLSAGKQAVGIELSTHSGVGPGLHIVPIKHLAVWEEVVQMSLCKYRARPHWAFASSRMFQHPACPLRDTIGAAAWSGFNAMQKQYDPHGLFVPPQWRDVEWRSKGGHYPACAPLGDCFCLEDSHCGARHKCAPGRIFQEYRVCVPDEAQLPSDDEL